MLAIYSNDAGQVVRATADDGRIYYYVASSMGEPVCGAWREEDSARVALDCGEAESIPKPDYAMDDCGELLDA